MNLKNKKTKVYGDAMENDCQIAYWEEDVEEAILKDSKNFALLVNLTIDTKEYLKRRKKVFGVWKR